MANIKEYLAQILSARYGKDVRQAIHDSIKDINDIATGAQDSATAAAGKAVEKANEALASSQNASGKAQEALESAEQAATYAKQAETVSGIHIASKEIAGVIKPGDFKVEEDGTVWMIKTVAGESMVLDDSVAGGLKIDRICGRSKQETGIITDDKGNEIVIPNPEYPQPIVSAGQKLVDGVVTDVGISKKLTGKNLLKNTAKSQTINGVTFTVNEDGSVTVDGTATSITFLLLNWFTLEVGDYVVSGCPTGGNKTTYSIKIDYAGTSTFDTGTGKTFTNDGGSLKVTIRIEGGATVSNLVFKPMIRLASIEDDTYEPYTEQTLTLNRVLRGIPLGQTIPDVIKSSPAHMDGVYWDEKTQKYYIGDTEDGVNGVYVQRMWEGNILDAFNGYRVSMDANWYDSEKSYSYELTGSKIPIMGFVCGACDHFQSYFFGEFYNKGIETGIMNDATYLVVNISKSLGICTTLDEFKTWCRDNDVRIIKILATPIETPLTDEEIIALHQLKTYQGVTHIFGSNDPDAPMIFKYSSSEIGGVTLENSNLHAVNEVLRRQILNEIPEVWPLERGGTGATDADTALANLGGVKASETIKTAFYDDAAESIGQLLDAKCAHARALNAPTVCIYGGWQNVDFGVFYAQVISNFVLGIYVKSETAYVVRCDSGTDTATYSKVALQSDIDVDIPYKIVIDDTAGTIDFIDR